MCAAHPGRHVAGPCSRGQEALEDGAGYSDDRGGGRAGIRCRYVVLPRGSEDTPEAFVRKLNAALSEVFSDEKFRARMHELGVGVEPTTPACVKAALQAEMDKWRPVVQAAGIKN